MKKEVRAVKTKKWVKTHSNKISKWACRLTTQGADLDKIVKQILTSGYGVNIGEQIFNQLTQSDIVKIRSNIISEVYK
jgi:Tfp pilus assembly major pilin PilA